MDKISQSRIKCWRSCHRKHHYAYIQQLKKRVPKVAPTRGKIVHRMLYLHAIGKNPEAAIIEANFKYGELFEEEKEIYGNILDDCREIFRRWCVKYENDNLKTVCAELFVEVPLTQKHNFIGYIDQIVTDEYGKYWILDFKVPKVIPNADERSSDIQLFLYAWAFEKCFHEKPAGIIWDYLRAKIPTVPSILKNGELSKNKNLDTTAGAYKKEIKRLGLDVGNYRDFLKDLRKRQNLFFLRIPTPTSDHVIKSIVEDARATAMEISDDATRNLRPDCAHMCDFFSLCHAELRGYDTEHMRRTDYAIKNLNDKNQDLKFR